MKQDKKIALLDIDDTIYNGGIIFPLMESEVKHNLLEQKYIDEVYTNKSLYQKGELQYEELSKIVVEVWAKGLVNKLYEDVAAHAKKFIDEDQHNFYSFAKPLLTLLEKTHDRITITNEPQFVAEPIVKLFNFTDYVSTIFEVIEGKFTGNVSRYNSTKADKKVSIHEVFEKYSHEQSFAYGDSIGDIGMFEEVTYPICVNASEKLKDAAIKNNWILSDPNTILDTTTKLLTK